MKQILKKSKILSFVFLLFLMSCSGNKRNQIYLDYINNTIPKLEEYDKKVIESFREVTGDNYIDDYEIVVQLDKKTIPYAKELLKYANEVYEEATIENVKNTQKIYIEWAETYLSYFIKLKEGLLADESIKQQVLDKTEKILIEANSLLEEYQKNVEDMRFKARLN